MLVAAHTDCFCDLPLNEVVARLAHLEFSCIELAIKEQGQFKPSDVVANFERAADICRNTRRLDILGFDTEIEAKDDEYYVQFDAICKLARAVKVVQITVPSGELGTPFNEEVEKLRKLVALAEMQGARVSIKSQVGRLSEDPDTVAVLCDNVKGLGLTLDPSHYICGPHSGRSIDKVMKYVYGVRLRDTSPDQFQVRVGQGEVDYGRLVGQLRQFDYDRALTVHIVEQDDVEHEAEMRKIRLLLESLL